MDAHLAAKIKDMTIIGARLANQLAEFQMMLARYVEGIDCALDKLNKMTEPENEKRRKTDGTEKETLKP
ncbi:hypothetical protein ES708_28519 [subsurface metagenome]